MKEREFYTYYIPALEKALSEDHVNTGFHVKGPDFFLDTTEKNKLLIDKYLDDTEGKDQFLDMVSLYFDALSHYFDKIDDININEYKKIIQEELVQKKKEFNLF